MKLIRRYHFWRALGSRIVPSLGSIWRLVAKRLYRYPKKKAPKATLPYTLLMFSDDRHLEMLTESLWSLASTWKALPNLCIVGDQGSTERVFRKTLSWWPQAWTYIAYEQIEKEFINDSQDLLVQFGRHHIFGRKFAAILYSARTVPTFYTDSDVLWYNQPRFIEAINLQESRLLLSIDPHPGYYEPMIDQSAQDLMQPPYACAGLLFISGWPWPEVELEKWVERAINLPPHSFAEQTIFAWLARRYGGYIPDSEIGAFWDDWYFILPCTFEPKWSTRHYFGPVRHHFHRDALLLRWGIFRRRG